ncbi:MAG TPA: 6-phosphofructokinase, partial [bacterium]|nr:6-phosphofructokinase [bacterium]
VSGDVDGSIAIKRKTGKKYSVYYQRVPLNKVAKNTRSMDPRFINRNGNHVTEAFINYARPLAGALPEIGYLKCFPLKK